MIHQIHELHEDTLSKGKHEKFLPDISFLKQWIDLIQGIEAAFLHTDRPLQNGFMSFQAIAHIMDPDAPTGLLGRGLRSAYGQQIIDAILFPYFPDKDAYQKLWAFMFCLPKHNLNEIDHLIRNAIQEDVGIVNVIVEMRRSILAKVVDFIDGQPPMCERMIGYENSVEDREYLSSWVEDLLSTRAAFPFSDDSTKYGINDFCFLQKIFSRKVPSSILKSSLLESHEEAIQRHLESVFRGDELSQLLQFIWQGHSNLREARSILRKADNPPLYAAFSAIADAVLSSIQEYLRLH